jgi:glycosyltransferase involved in cell wall biosynthesis
LNEQWPAIIRRYPGATITLIGSNPPDQLRRAASRVGVSLFEYVDNYAQLLQRADIVLFLDQSGTGIKTRAIEAMANAKPLIVTDSVLEGIGACHRAECLVANTPEDAATAAFQLLESPALMSSLGVRAQHFIRCRFTNETIGEQWERLYMEVACD